ncbi:MAG: L-iditol 2-dehydrogenase [Gammaproteobacteria bacterium]|jgi:threonine dehydrogenase-like Zn-dependent dehydrogenase|nr:L-iditol 2-dehydrogenase [Gammaproteobacteria bacterium]
MSASFDTTSRAARFQGPRRITVEEIEVRRPEAGQVRVRLEGCGVCGSNLPVWEGRPWFTYPREPGTPGHEGWGVIDSVGEGVNAFAIGDRVALLSGHAYAEHDFAGPDALVKLPPELAGSPFPGEPLACAMNIFRRSEISAGQSVAIVGIGFLGATLTALAVRAGARVVALSRRAFALEMAEECGASALVGLEDPTRALREARQYVPDGGYDRVIECVGSQEALDVAAELAATRARLVIAGYHQDGERRVNLQQWNWRGLDVINAHERDPAQYRRGMQEAVDLVVSGELDPWLLFTHQFPLEDLSAAFDALARRPAGFLKALVVYS